MIPPMPMTGTRAVRATCQTIRKATGLMAGPDSPPVMLASRGRRVSMSIAMPVIVLISESASAPPASALRAITLMSVTFGESFTMSGLRVRSRTARTTRSAATGSTPKTTPPAFTFGQEMFTSTAATPSIPSNRSASAAYSSTLVP